MLFFKYPGVFLPQGLGVAPLPTDLCWALPQALESWENKLFSLLLAVAP